ncbi:hypothetical protein [Campylobacter concisus]|uniref:hypothetical protein n=1 Tax=Campylobacter concisus TaxID=199 RepID=UPI00215651ED|nr:hypothetical protein [Campylobacter concisus]
MQINTIKRIKTYERDAGIPKQSETLAMLNNITYSPNLNNNSLFEGKEFASRVNYKKVMGNSTNFTGAFKSYNDDKQTIWGKKSDDDLEGQKIRQTLERFGVSFSNEGRELLESSNISVDEFIERYSKVINRSMSQEIGDYGLMDQKSDHEEQDNRTDTQKQETFKPMQVTKKFKTYDMQADEKFKAFYKFIKTEFDNGESIFEILEKVANKKVDKIA